jgi:hypothetical protein
LQVSGIELTLMPCKAKQLPHHHPFSMTSRSSGLPSSLFLGPQSQVACSCMGVHERSDTNKGPASVFEGVVVTEELKRYLDGLRTDAQTNFLKGRAAVEGKRHRGDTVKASHQEELDSLLRVLKETEIACSIAESGCVSREKDQAKIQAIVRTMSIYSMAL